MDGTTTTPFRVLTKYVLLVAAIPFLLLLAWRVVSEPRRAAYERRCMNIGPTGPITVSSDPNPAYVALVNEPVVLDDHETIDRIRLALQNAKRVHPNHPVTVRRTCLSFDVEGERCVVTVIETPDADNGTLVEVWGGTSFRCDGIAPLLETAVATEPSSSR